MCCVFAESDTESIEDEESSESELDEISDEPSNRFAYTHTEYECVRRHVINSTGYDVT